MNYILKLLKNAAEHGVKINSGDLSTKEIIERELLFTKSNSDLIEIQFLEKQQQNKVMTVIVDKELCLTAEVKDREKDNDE